MTQDFDKLNSHIVYTKVKSRSDAIKLKDDAIEVVAGGKTVVIFFENQHYLYLAPGQDPYKIRKEIAEYIANPTKDKESTVDTSSEPVTPETATTSTTPKTKSSSSKK